MIYSRHYRDPWVEKVRTPKAFAQGLFCLVGITAATVFYSVHGALGALVFGLLSSGLMFMHMRSSELPEDLFDVSSFQGGRPLYGVDTVDDWAKRVRGPYDFGDNPQGPVKMYDD